MKRERRRGYNVDGSEKKGSTKKEGTECREAYIFDLAEESLIERRSITISHFTSYCCCKRRVVLPLACDDASDFHGAERIF